MSSTSKFKLMGQTAMTLSKMSLWRLAACGSAKAGHMHTSYIHQAIVKSKWTDHIPENVSVYDFVTKNFDKTPENIAYVSR